MINILLIFIIIILIYGIFNLNRKIDTYEKLISERDSIIELRNEWINNIKDRLIFIEAELKKVDSRGSFESDDEVGFTFKEIKRLVEIVTGFK